MEIPEEVRGDAKLKVLIRHLVSDFPADLDSVSASRGHVSRLRHRALWGWPRKGDPGREGVAR